MFCIVNRLKYILLSYDFFLHLNTIFGFSSNFVNKYVTYLAKCYCVIINLSIVLVIMHYAILSRNIDNQVYKIIATTLEFLPFSLFALWTNQRHIFKYYNGVKVIYKTMGYKIFPRSPALCMTSLLCVIPLKCLSVYLSLILFYHTSLDLLTFLLNSLVILSVFNSLNSIMVFELFWKQMNLLRRSLKKRLNKYKLDDENKMKILKHTVHVYRNILSNINGPIFVVQLQVMVSLIGNCTTVLYISWISLVCNTKAEMSIFISCMIDFLILVTISGLPGAFAELAIQECNEIYTTLVRQLLMCKDKAYRSLLHNVLQYLKVRPPKYEICCLFPLDMTLSLGFANVCITYSLSIAQLNQSLNTN